MPACRSGREPSGLTRRSPPESGTTVHEVPGGIDAMGSPSPPSVMNSSPSPPSVTLDAPTATPAPPPPAPAAPAGPPRAAPDPQLGLGPGREHRWLRAGRGSDDEQASEPA